MSYLNQFPQKAKAKPIGKILQILCLTVKMAPPIQRAHRLPTATLSALLLNLHFSLQSGNVAWAAYSLWKWVKISISGKSRFIMEF